MNSPGMFAAGIVLDVLGGLALGTSITAFAVSGSSSGDLSGIVAAVVGLPALGGAVLFLGVGIPLTVVGAQPADPSSTTYAPVVRVGAGSASATWSF